MAAISRRQAVTMPGAFGAGVGASLVMMVVMALLRFTTNTISIPELMEESLIRLTGGRIESFFINALGVGGKALLLVTIVEGTLLLGGLLGLAFARFRPAAGANRLMSGLLFGLLVGLLLNAVFLPLVGQGFFGSSALEATAPPDVSRAIYGSSLAPFGLPVWLNMFVLSIAFGLAVAALLRRTRPQVVVANMQTATDAPETLEARPVVTESTMPRRDFSRALMGGVAALAGGAVLWLGIRNALAPPPVAGVQVVEDSTTPEPTGVTTAEATAQATAVSAHETAQPTAQAGSTAEAAGASTPPGFAGVKPKLVPEVTSVDTFYITTKNFIDPTVDGKSWKLSFKGLVDKPFSITLDELKAMPSMERIETLACISNPTGGSLIGNARWKGVDFATLLKKAGPQKGAVDVIVRGQDGYADSFPLDVALKNECILVYEMNGAPLTQKHGFPARLLVPGIYGMKNCKWITQVELVDYDFMGYWESQGWSDSAHYQTMSRIDYPDNDNIPAKPVYVGGVAFAGDRGIKRVEVSTDGGKSWHDAQVRPPIGKYTWVLWTYPWMPTPGAYTLKVRATDGKGNLQTNQEQGTYPDGATGYHTVQVRANQV